MCMYNLVGETFIDMIKSFYPNAKRASAGREVVVRCFYCGDSKIERHAHLYISVPQTQDELSMYHCKKCPAHGVVDDEFLRRLGCTDSNTLVDVIRHNQEVMSLPKYKTLKTINIYPLHWDRYSERPYNQAKLNYINGRIGSNFGIQDLVKIKMFLNLGDVIQINNLQFTRDPKVVTALDENFIGFISYDNSYCGLRKVTDAQLYPSIDKRYINYSLVNKVDDKKNFYVIPSRVDVFNPTPVKIHITEGQFDILSVFYNLNNCNDMQSVYIASGGKSYAQALEFILTESGIVNYEVHFYPDKDVSDSEFYYDVLRKINGLMCDIYVHRNVYPNEKDYGVPIDRIKDQVTKVQ